jgi:hypothetical protein
MAYHVIFDVADRIPDIALGAVALVLFAGVGLVALVDLDAVLARWPVLLTAGASLVALEAVVNRSLLLLVFSGFPFAMGVGSELYHRRVPSGAAAQGTACRRHRDDAGVVPARLAMSFGLPMISAVGLSRQLADGEVVVVEGPVRIDLEVFGKNECISVAGRSFCYSDSNVTAGFNRTRALGGPMRNGLQVRISSIGDTIVRVEVDEER